MIGYFLLKGEDFMNNQEFADIITKVHSFYFTEYVLFSDQYALIVKREWRNISEDYLSYLKDMVIYLSSYPVYPLEIMNRFKEYVNLMLENITDLDRKKQLLAIKEVLDVVSWKDSKEIFLIEYFKRYATVENSKDFAFLSVRHLWEDLQKDFINFNYLIGGSQSAMPSDFLFFLNRLLFDFPDIFKYRPMKKRILSLLKKSSLEGKEAYIHLIKHQNARSDLLGFHLGEAEDFYCLSVVTKFLFSSDIEKDLKEMPRFYFYNESFIKVLNDEVYNLVGTSSFPIQIKQNILEIINFMRTLLKEYPISNHDAFLSNLNQLIVEINGCEKTSTAIYKLMEEYERRIGFPKFKKYYTQEEFLELFPLLEDHIRYTPQVMEYLFGKISLEAVFGLGEKQKEVQKIIPYILDYLYKSYPRLFFDPTISKNAKNIVSSLSIFERGEFMRKLNRIRKD